MDVPVLYYIYKLHIYIDILMKGRYSPPKQHYDIERNE